MLRKPVGLCTFSSFLLFNEFSIELQGRPAASGGEVGVRARSSCSCSCEAALRCHFTPLLGFQRWKGERFSLCVWRIVGYCSVMSQVFYRRLRFACANTSRPRGCEYNRGAGSFWLYFLHSQVQGHRIQSVARAQTNQKLRMGTCIHRRPRFSLETSCGA